MVGGDFNLKGATEHLTILGGTGLIIADTEESIKLLGLVVQVISLIIVYLKSKKKEV